MTAQTQLGSGDVSQADLLWPASGEREDRAPWAWLMGLMAVATILRAIALDQQLWYDEIMTLLEYVRAPLGQIVTTYTSQNQHMLYSALARFSVVSFGEHAWSLRLPAVVFGVLTVPALYFCARRFATRGESLLACGLLTLSYHHIWFSQNARGYTGLVFWTILTTYFFTRGAGQAGLKWWAWYGVAMALGMYTHLTMGFIAVAHALVCAWLLLARRKENGRWPINATPAIAGFFLAALLTLALYAPVLDQMVSRTVGGEVTRGAPEVARAEWRNPLWLVLETARGLAGGNLGIGLSVLFGGGLIALAGAWSFWRRERAFLAMMVVPVLVTALAMLALSRNLWPRFFFFAIGFALLLLVRGVKEWWQGPLEKKTGPAVARIGLATTFAVIFLAMCWQARAAWIYPKQDYQGAMEFVEAQRAPSDAVVLVGLTQMPYQKYYQRDWPAIETTAQFQDMVAKGGTVWALYTLPVFVESRYPDLWNTLQRECPTAKIFRGTMGGGEVYVCRAGAVRSAAPVK